MNAMDRRKNRPSNARAILDQKIIMMDQQDYDHFLAILDRSPENNEKLRKLLRTKAPWER
jgi:uncharacterized protein (DUF1778 family)